MKKLKKKIIKSVDNSIRICYNVNTISDEADCSFLLNVFDIGKLSLFSTPSFFKEHREIGAFYLEKCGKSIDSS